MKVSSFLALRFLAGKRRSWLLSLLTWLAILGVLVSVLAFVVVQAVMSGFQRDLQKHIIGFTSHISITYDSESNASQLLESKLLQNPYIEEIQHFIEGEAVLRDEDGNSQGLRLRGVDPSKMSSFSTWKVFFEEGEDWSSLSAHGEELPGILLGAELASSLGIVPVLSEKVELLYPLGDVGPTGKVEPNIRSFRVIGVFKSGYYEYDSKFAIIDLPESRYLFGSSSFEKIGVFLKDPSKVNRFSKSELSLPGVEDVKFWPEEHERLFSALKLQGIGMIFVLGLMLTLASFNILSMLMMVVYERRKEIAVLRALGMPRRAISAIFYRAGFGIGLFGGILGAAMGVVLCYWLKFSKIKLPSLYYLEALPIYIDWKVVVLSILLAVFLSLLATIFPAREVFRRGVIESIRSE